MKHPSIFLVLATLAHIGPVFASSALLEVLDSDNTGYLTLDETQNNPDVHLQFSNIDRNKNDRLEKEELQLLNMPLSFSDLDVDESVGISPEEASTLRELQNQFSQLDRNEDQLIDPEEFSEFVAAPGSG
jgi:Ca2+-binding EF-hand superfamily protein